MAPLTATLLDLALNIVCGGKKITNSQVHEGEVEEREGQVHMVICALDYPGTGHELTCTQDGDNMKQLASQCGVNDVVSLYNNEANTPNVSQTIQQVGSRCQPGDYFIFYYSGHGTSVPDTSGDEDDQKDEAFCFVTADGQLDFGAFMTDDDFADVVTSSVDEDVKIIVLADCCHSGTICDFNSRKWSGYRALGISGCEDTQTSGDTGRGGIFTHSLLMAIDELSKDNDSGHFSCSETYNRTLDKDADVFDSAQDISLSYSQGASGGNMAWPLCPPSSYSADRKSVV